MKENCIQRVPNDRVTIIREWQKHFCKDLGQKKSNVAAALMSFFEHTHNWKIEQFESEKHINKVRKRHGEKELESHLLQWHTQKELQDAIGNLAGKNVMIECKKFLIQTGLISEHQNPNPSYRYDQTIYYLFHPEIANNWINKVYIPFKKGVTESCESPAIRQCPKTDDHCPKINNGRPEINDHCPKINNGSSENGQTITKFTTQFTPKFTTQNKLQGKFDNLPTYKEYQEGRFFLDDEQAAEIVLRFFVSHTGKKIAIGNQKGANTNRNLAKKWLKKKYSIVELCQVIEMKKAEWEFDLEMSKYIRLSTLFNGKFIGYVQDLINLQQNPLEAKKFKLQIQDKKRNYERRFGKVRASKPIVEQESVEDWFKN